MYDISVVVPIYNVAEYLGECLDSLCRQEKIRLQVICVDDKSTDISMDIVLEYKNKLECLEIYQNDENRGLAYTRNVGIEHARGKYIFFLDSDDFIADNVLYDLFEYAEHRKLEVLSFDTKMFSTADFVGTFNPSLRIRKHKYNYVTDGISMMSDYLNNNEMYRTACTTLYNYSFLVENNIKFVPYIIHEDIPFTFEILIKAEQVGCINKLVYYYRQRKKSILHEKNFEKQLYGLMQGIRCMKSLMYKKEYSDRQINIMCRYIDSVKWMVKLYYLVELSDGKTVEEEIYKFIFEEEKLFDSEKLENYFSIEDIKKLEDYDEISIYGAGNNARFLIYLLMKKWNVAQIYVTDVTTNPAQMYGVPVRQWNTQCDCVVTPIIIAVTKKWQREIVEKLENANIKNYIVAKDD